MRFRASRYTCGVWIGGGGGQSRHKVSASLADAMSGQGRPVNVDPQHGLRAVIAGMQVVVPNALFRLAPHWGQRWHLESGAREGTAHGSARSAGVLAFARLVLYRGVINASGQQNVRESLLAVLSGLLFWPHDQDATRYASRLVRGGLKSYLATERAACRIWQSKDVRAKRWRRNWDVVIRRRTPLDPAMPPVLCALLWFRGKSQSHYGAELDAVKEVAANTFEHFALSRRACERCSKVISDGSSKYDACTYVHRKCLRFQRTPMCRHYQSLKLDLSRRNCRPTQMERALVGLRRRLPMSAANTALRACCGTTLR